MLFEDQEKDKKKQQPAPEQKPVEQQAVNPFDDPPPAQVTRENTAPLAPAQTTTTTLDERALRYNEWVADSNFVSGLFKANPQNSRPVFESLFNRTTSNVWGSLTPKQKLENIEKLAQRMGIQTDPEGKWLDSPEAQRFINFFDNPDFGQLDGKPVSISRPVDKEKNPMFPKYRASEAYTLAYGLNTIKGNKFYEALNSKGVDPDATRMMQANPDYDNVVVRATREGIIRNPGSKDRGEEFDLGPQVKTHTFRDDVAGRDVTVALNITDENNKKDFVYDYTDSPDQIKNRLYTQVYIKAVDPDTASTDEDYRKQVYKNMSSAVGWDQKTSDFLLANHFTMSNGDTNIVQVGTGRLMTKADDPGLQSFIEGTGEALQSFHWTGSIPPEALAYAAKESNYDPAKFKKILEKVTGEFRSLEESAQNSLQSWMLNYQKENGYSALLSVLGWVNRFVTTFGEKVSNDPLIADYDTWRGIRGLDDSPELRRSHELMLGRVKGIRALMEGEISRIPSDVSPQDHADLVEYARLVSEKRYYQKLAAVPEYSEQAKAKIAELDAKISSASSTRLIAGGVTEVKPISERARTALDTINAGQESIFGPNPGALISTGLDVVGIITGSGVVKKAPGAISKGVSLLRNPGTAYSTFRGFLSGTFTRGSGILPNWVRVGGKTLLPMGQGFVLGQVVITDPRTEFSFTPEYDYRIGTYQNAIGVGFGQLVGPLFRSGTFRASQFAISKGAPAGFGQGLGGKLFNEIGEVGTEFVGELTAMAVTEPKSLQDEEGNWSAQKILGIIPYVVSGQLVGSGFPASQNAYQRLRGRKLPDSLQMSKPIRRDDGTWHVAVFDRSTNFSSVQPLDSKTSAALEAGKAAEVNGVMVDPQKSLRMTADQFTRLKTKIDTSFKSALRVSIVGNYSDFRDTISSFASQSFTFDENGDPITMTDLLEKHMSGKGPVADETGFKDDRSYGVLSLLTQSKNSDLGIEINIEELSAGGSSLARTIAGLAINGYVSVDGSGRVSITESGSAEFDKIAKVVADFGVEVESAQATAQTASQQTRSEQTRQLLDDYQNSGDPEYTEAATKFLSDPPVTISAFELAALSDKQREVLIAAISVGNMKFDVETGFTTAAESSAAGLDGKTYYFGDGTAGVASRKMFQLGRDANELSQSSYENSYGVTYRLSDIYRATGVNIPRNILEEAQASSGNRAEIASVTKNEDGTFRIEFSDVDGNSLFVASSVEAQQPNMSPELLATAIDALKARDISTGRKPRNDSEYSIKELQDYIQKAKNGYAYWTSHTKGAGESSAFLLDVRSPLDQEMDNQTVAEKMKAVLNRLNIFDRNKEFVSLGSIGTDPEVVLSEQELAALKSRLQESGFTEPQLQRMTPYQLQSLDSNKVSPQESIEFLRQQRQNDQVIARENFVQKVPAMGVEAQQLADKIFSPVINKTEITPTDFKNMTAEEKEVVRAGLKSGDLVFDNKSKTVKNRSYTGRSRTGVRMDFGSSNSNTYLINEIGKAFESGDVESGNALLRRLAIENKLQLDATTLDTLKSSVLSDYNKINEEVEKEIAENGPLSSVNLKNFQPEFSADFLPENFMGVTPVEQESEDIVEAMEAVDITEQVTASEPPPPPRRTRGLKTKEEIKNIPDKDISWKNTENPGELDSVVFLRNKDGGPRGRAVYTRNQNGEYVNISNPSDVISEQSLRQRIASREFDYGTVKAKSSLFSTETPVEQSQTRTRNAAEVIGGQRAVDRMAPLVLTKQQLKENEQTIRNGIGTLHLTQNLSIQYDANDPESSWGPNGTFISDFVVDPAAEGVVFVSLRVAELIHKAQGNSGKPPNGMANTIDELSSLIKVMEANPSAYGLTEADVTIFRSFDTHLDSLRESGNTAVSYSILNPNFSSQAGLVKDAKITTYRKFESTVRHEFIHKLVIEALGYDLLNSPEIGRKLLDRLNSNPDWPKLVEFLSQGAYADLAADGDMSGIIHEILAHGSDIQSLISGLGINPNGPSGDAFFSVYYDILKTFNEHDPDIVNKITMYSDPEITRKLHTLYETNRLENYVGSPADGEVLTKRGGNTGDKISAIVRSAGLNSADRKPFIWEGDGLKRVTVAGTRGVVTLPTDQVISFEVAREDGTFSKTNLGNARSDVELNLIDLATNDEARTRLQNSTYDDFLSWVTESGFDGYFNSYSLTDKYKATLVNSESVRSKLTPKKTGLYSIDLEYRDGLTFLTNKQYEESKKNHEKGEGPVHITSSLIIDPKTGGMGLGDAPKFIVDKNDKGFILLNLGMQMVINDVRDGQLTIGNPQRVNALLDSLGTEIANRTLYGYMLLAALSDSYLNGTEVYLAHKEHFPMLAELVSVLTGQSLDKAMETMSTMTEEQLAEKRRTETSPAIFPVYRPDRSFDLSRATMFHEGTHRILDELLGPNIFTTIENAGVDLSENPDVKYWLEDGLIGSPYESVLSYPEAAKRNTVIQEILAFPGSGADSLANLGVKDVESVGRFVRAYVAIINTIARTHGYMTAVQAARYAAPDFVTAVESIYEKQKIELPTLGIARKPVTVSGGRGLFSRDVGTSFEFTRVSKGKAVKGVWPTVTLVNGVDIDLADIPQEARLVLKNLVRNNRFEAMDKELEITKSWLRRDLKELEDEIARVRMLLLGSDGLSEISAMLYSTAEPDESMSDEYGEQYYDEPYRGHVSVDRASGLITLRAPSSPFYRDLSGLRVNSVEEGMALLRQARLSELEVQRLEKKATVDWFDTNPVITEYFGPDKNLGKDMKPMTPEELAERTHARAVAAKRFLRSMDSPYTPNDVTGFVTSPLVGISMADLADMTRRGRVLDKLLAKEAEPGVYYAALKHGPEFSELNPVLAVEVAKIMVETMRSRRNLPEFKGKDMLSPEVFPTWAGPLIEMGLAPSSVQRDPKGFINYATQMVREGIEIPDYMTSQMVGKMMFSIESRFPLIPSAVLKQLGDLALSTSDVEFDALMTYDSLKEMANLMGDPGLMDDTTISSILNNQAPILKVSRQYAKLHEKKNAIIGRMAPSKRGLMSRDLVPVTEGGLTREFTPEELRQAAIANTIYTPAVESAIEPQVTERVVLINGKSWEDIEAPQQLKDFFKRMQKFENPPESADQIISNLEKDIRRWSNEKLKATEQWQKDALDGYIAGAQESIEWLKNNPVSFMAIAREEADTRVYRQPARKLVPNYQPSGVSLGDLLIRDWEYSTESYKVSLARRVRKAESEQERLNRQRKLSEMSPEEIEAAYPEYFRLFNRGHMARFGHSVWSFMVGYADIETRYRMINPRFFEPKSSTEYNRAPSQEAIDYAISRVEEFHDVVLAYVKTKFDETRGGFVTPWTELGKDSSAYVRMDLDNFAGVGSTMEDIETNARGQEDVRNRAAGLTNRRLGRNREVTRLLNEAKDASKKGGGLMSRDIEVDEANVSVIDGFYDNAEAFINGFNPKNMTPHNKNLPNKAPGSQWLTIFTNAPGITQDNLEWNGLVSFLLANANTTLSKDDIIEYLKTSRITTETRVRRNRMFDDEDDSIIYGQERYNLKGRVKQMFELLIKTPGRIKGLTRQIMPTLSEQDLPENHVLKYRPNSRFYQEWVVVYVHPETGYEYPIASAATKELALGRFYRETAKIGNQAYQDSHWQGEENVNSQVRAAVYENSNGEEVALINEIQSDIHQAEVHEGTVPALTRQELKEASDRATARISELLKNNARFVNDGMKFHKDMLMAMAALRGRIAGSEYAQDWVQEGGKDGRALIEAKFGKDADLNSPEVVRFILENGLLTVSGLLERDILASPDMEVVINDYRGMADFYTQLRVEQELSARSRNKSASTDFTVGETPGPVPETPFSQNWMAVALKRAVAHFVQLGHDTIHWTTGMQQLNRYEDDLRQQVDALEYEVESRIVDGKEEKTFVVTGVKNGKKTMDMVFDNYGYTEIMTPAGDMRSVSMAAMIGKTMADKIMKSGAGTGVLSGPDLTIGGGLYFHVYDKMLPQLFKKIYGVEPVKTTVDLSGQDTEVQQAVPSEKFLSQKGSFSKMYNIVDELMNLEGPGPDFDMEMLDGSIVKGKEKSLTKLEKLFIKMDDAMFDMDNSDRDYDDDISVKDSPLKVKLSEIPKSVRFVGGATKGSGETVDAPFLLPQDLNPARFSKPGSFMDLKDDIFGGIIELDAAITRKTLDSVRLEMADGTVVNDLAEAAKILDQFHKKMEGINHHSGTSLKEGKITPKTKGLPVRLLIKKKADEVTHEVWSAKLTPEMVARVKKGQSLYSRESDLYREMLDRADSYFEVSQAEMDARLVNLPPTEITADKVRGIVDREFAVITAHKLGLGKDENNRRNDELRKKLLTLGFSVVDVKGKYGGYMEDSFFVYADKDNLTELLDLLAMENGQESILHGKAGRFYFREYGTMTVKEVSSEGLDYDPTGKKRIAKVDGTEIYLPNGEVVYFSLNPGKTVGEPSAINEQKILEARRTIDSYNSEFADPSKTMEQLKNNGFTETNEGTIAKDSLLPNGDVNPENPPHMEDGDGNYISQVWSERRPKKDEEGNIVGTEAVYFFMANGKQRELPRGQYTAVFGRKLYRKENGDTRLYTLSQMPPPSKNKVIDYLKSLKRFKGSTEEEINALAVRLLSSDELTPNEKDLLRGAKTAAYASKQVAGPKTLTMVASGKKTYRVLQLSQRFQKAFDTRNPELVNQRIPRPRSEDFETSEDFNAAMDKYRRHMAPILINQMMRMAQVYASTSATNSEFYETQLEEYGSFYYEDKTRLMAELNKDFGEFDGDIGELASMLIALTSAGTKLANNIQYTASILAGLVHYHEEGEVLPLVQYSSEGEIIYNKDGEPKKPGTHSAALIKLSMLLNGFIPVREGSFEYDALVQSGETLEIVNPRDILGDSAGFINDEYNKIQYVRSPLLTKHIKRDGSLAGAVKYLVSDVPRTETHNIRQTFSETIFGQKIGSFMNNMLGMSMTPTVDIWMARYFALIEGNLYEQHLDGSVTYRDGSNISQDDYYFYAAVVREASRRLNLQGISITPSRLQSLPWVTMLNAFAGLGRNIHSTPAMTDLYLDVSRLERGGFRDRTQVKNSRVTKLANKEQSKIIQKAVAAQNIRGEIKTAGERRMTGLASRDSDALQAQQELLAANDQKLADMDADAWISVAERLVTHGKLADTEIRAIRLLAERGDMDDMRTYIMGLSKQSVWELFVNVGRVALLLGLRNIQKNIGGNSLRQFMDEISRVPASVLDIVLMNFNKAIGGTNMDRSTTSLLTNPLDTLAAWKYALTKGLREGGKEFIEILRGEDMNVVFEHPSLFRERTTGIRFLRPLEIFEQYGWRFQGAMDRPFNATAFYRTLHELQTMRMREEHKKGNMITFEEAEGFLTVADYELAEMYALAATYQKKNVVSDKYYAMIDGLPPVFRAIISNITKFVKTPLNVVDYILDYTGLWPIAKLVHREYGTEDWISWKNSIKRVLDNPQDRKIIAMAISQGAIGSLITFIGYKMGLAGMLMAFFDREEKKEGEQMEAKGTSWGEFSIAGKSVDISWLSPVSFYLVMGATMAQTDQTYERKLGELTDKYNQAVEEGDAGTVEKAKQELDKHKNSSPFHEKVSRIFKNLALQTPFLRQLDEIKTAYDQNNLLPGLADKWFSPEVYVPAIVKEIARTKDEFDRVVSKEGTAERLTEKVQAAIPSLPGIRRLGKMLEDTGIPGVRNVGKVLQGREALPVKYDMFGRPIRTGAGYSAFAGTELNVDKLTSEMDRLNVSISKPVGATAAEENRLRKEKGELYAPKLLAITESPEYKKSDDKTKKRILESAIRTIGDEQRNQKLTDEEERHNLKIVTDREYYRTQIKSNPGQFARETTITDKDTIRSFAGGRLEPTVSFTQVLDDIRKTKNLDQWLNAKFNYEFLASERQPLALAQANYQEFVKDPQSFIIRLWARDKQYDQSQKANQERRQELFREGKSKEEVEKQLRKESNRRGVETRRRQGSIKQITVTK